MWIKKKKKNPICSSFIVIAPVVSRSFVVCVQEGIVVGSKACGVGTFCCKWIREELLLFGTPNENVAIFGACVDFVQH